MFAGLCSSLRSSWCQFTKRLGFNWQPQEQCPKVDPFSNSAVIFDPGHSRNAGGLIESERESCISRYVSSHTLTDRKGRTECDWLTKLRLQLETQHNTVYTLCDHWYDTFHRHPCVVLTQVSSLENKINYYLFKNI